MFQPTAAVPARDCWHVQLQHDERMIRICVCVCVCAISAEEILFKIVGAKFAYAINVQRWDVVLCVYCIATSVSDNSSWTFLHMSDWELLLLLLYHHIAGRTEGARYDRQSIPDGAMAAANRSEREHIPLHYVSCVNYIYSWDKTCGSITTEDN